MNFKHLRYFWAAARAGTIVRAAGELHLAPQTLSAQIAALESDLGAALFVKRGRTLELSDAGRVAFEHAQQIFALGSELRDAMRELATNGRPVEFRIGIADAVPKSIACLLIEPATRLPTPVRLVCREGKLDGLLAELGTHRLDVVIAGAPIPPSARVRAYNHRLGGSGVSFFASQAVRAQLAGAFPGCLDGAPMLMPGVDATLRPRLERWLQARGVRLRIVGEFDDSALMKAFGQRGAGVFVSPTTLEAEIESQYGVRAIGRTNDISEEYFAISVERRVTHPCVNAIAGAAREHLFVDDGP